MFPFFFYLAHGYYQLEVNVKSFCCLGIAGHAQRIMCVFPLRPATGEKQCQAFSCAILSSLSQFFPSSGLISLFLVHHVASSAFARIVR